jgi:multidrug efflux pump subunit AcrA (membrane-fusion protein)
VSIERNKPGLPAVLSIMSSSSLSRALRHALACGLIFLAAAAFAEAPRAPEVIVSEARVEHFVDRLEALGTLSAIESVTLTVSVTETISAIYFDDGDRVEKDQILVEMTSAEEHAQLEEARALKEEGYRQFRRVQSLEAGARPPNPCSTSDGANGRPPSHAWRRSSHGSPTA